MKCLRKKHSDSDGFTLLEVIITLGILTTMIIAVSSLLRASFDVRFALSQQGQVTHRLNTAMQKISLDVSHAFILAKNDVVRNGSERATRTIFNIGRESGADKLSFTLMNHTPLKYNAREGDSAYVVYELKESREFPGRKNLYRGVFGKIPTSFKDDPPMKLLAKHIKNISFKAWRGDAWSKNKWNTEKRETRDKLPHMVRISIEAWIEDPDIGEQLTQIHELTTTYSSVAYLPYAAKFKELKDQSGSMKL